MEGPALSHSHSILAWQLALLLDFGEFVVHWLSKHHGYKLTFVALIIWKTRLWVLFYQNCSRAKEGQVGEKLMLWELEWVFIKYSFQFLIFKSFRGEKVIFYFSFITWKLSDLAHQHYIFFEGKMLDNLNTVNLLEFTLHSKKSLSSQEMVTAVQYRKRIGSFSLDII